MLKPGDLIKDRYRVSSLIGQGGMSSVYLVEDTSLQSRWAMKETLDIFPDRDKSDIIEQFQREARILANLSHPGLPKVIDCFTQGGKHYLVEEFIDGLPCDEMARQLPRFDEMKVLGWAAQICDLLEFLHQSSIIYRDLKPGNVMIDSADRVYLVDFGIARFFHGGKAKDTVIIGTPGFASPEHYGRGETDRRSDVFSLGATLHHLLTGVDPADKPFHFEIPYFINPQVSFHTSSIVMKCLDMDPARRFQTAAEVKEAILGRAMPNLRKLTRPLEPVRRLSGKECYRRDTDFLGNTAKFLSYTSVFPASMGISGVLAFGVSLFGPIPGLIAGMVSFPVLCVEFWKRLDKVFQDQMAAIQVGPEGLSFRGRTMNLQSHWQDVMEVRVEKNTSPWAVRKLKNVLVKTRGGHFYFDASFGDCRRLIDTLITESGLALSSDSSYLSIYTKP